MMLCWRQISNFDQSRKVDTSPLSHNYHGKLNHDAQTDLTEGDQMSVPIISGLFFHWVQNLEGQWLIRNKSLEERCKRRQNPRSSVKPSARLSSLKRLIKSVFVAFGRWKYLLPPEDFASRAKVVRIITAALLFFLVEVRPSFGQPEDIRESDGDFVWNASHETIGSHVWEKWISR